MTQQMLAGLKVAILVTDSFEQVELIEPRKALEEAGAETSVVSPQAVQARPEDFDALLLPGGVLNPDSLRLRPEAIRFVKAFFDAGKKVAALCHGPWSIIEAGTAKGKRIASWPSLKTDLRNAGPEWVDEEVVVDGNLVSSRKPSEFPAFNCEMVGLFSRRGPADEIAQRIWNSA